MNKLGFRVRVALDAACLGPRRRRRSMEQALRRLDDLPADAPVRRSRRWRLRPGVVITIVVAIAVVLIWQAAPSGHNSAAPAADSNGTPRAANAPTTTRLTSMARLLPAPHDVPVSKSFAVLYHDRGHAVSWEPCRPIHYVIRKGEEPSNYDTLLQRAIHDVSQATGLKFVSDGTTGEQLLYDPTARLPYQPQRYGDRWAPVLISWSDPAESPDLAGTEAGFAAPVDWAIPGEPRRIVSGTVAFSLPALDTLNARPHGATLVRDVLLHELAHLVGLDHVTDKSQIMYPTVTRPIAGYGPGDLFGLATVGTGSCYADY